VGTLSHTDGGSLYDPEQNVLAFGAFNSYSKPSEAFVVEGSTKSMRKIKTGDQLVFITLGQNTETHALTGVVQYFLKT